MLACCDWVLLPENNPMNIEYEVNSTTSAQTCDRHLIEKLGQEEFDSEYAKYSPEHSRHYGIAGKLHDVCEECKELIVHEKGIVTLDRAMSLDTTYPPGLLEDLQELRRRIVFVCASCFNSR